MLEVHLNKTSINQRLRELRQANKRVSLNLLKDFCYFRRTIRKGHTRSLF